MSDDRLHYEEIAKGLTWETGGITVTESHILAFAGLSGDFYDLHVDDDYARSLGFPGKVAHGLLGLAAGTSPARSWRGTGSAPPFG